MGMTVTLDGMNHTRAIHHDLGKEMGLGECAASGGDLSPIDLLAIGLASCLILVMAKSARKKGIDLTGTWAEVADEVKDYKIAAISVKIRSPQNPSDADREFLEKESHNCPVYLAIEGNVTLNVLFDWGSSARSTEKLQNKIHPSHSTCSASSPNP